MSFHVKRSKTADHETLTAWSGARSTRWVTPPDGRSVLEIQTTHTPEVFLDVPDDKNLTKPPYHWHWYQEEFFTIKEGRYLFTFEGRTTTLSSTDPMPIRIPPHARHTFAADPTSPTPCTIEISTATSPLSTTDPTSHGASEKFFRNLYSYLDDCYEQKVEPSVPQLLLMLDAAEVSLAFPWGPDWVMRGVSWAMGVVVGRWFGGYVLGYRASYPEYYMEETRKGK